MKANEKLFETESKNADALPLNCQQKKVASQQFQALNDGVVFIEIIQYALATAINELNALA